MWFIVPWRVRCFCCLMLKETSIAGLDISWKILDGWFRGTPMSANPRIWGLNITSVWTTWWRMCTCGRMPLSWDHLKSWQNWIWFINYSWCDDCFPSGIRSKERRCDLINNVWFYPKNGNISSRYGQQLIQMETPPVNHLTAGCFLWFTNQLILPCRHTIHFHKMRGLLIPYINHGFWGCV